MQKAARMPFFRRSDCFDGSALSRIVRVFPAAGLQIVQIGVQFAENLLRVHTMYGTGLTQALTSGSRTADTTHTILHQNAGHAHIHLENIADQCILCNTLPSFILSVQGSGGDRSYGYRIILPCFPLL